MTKALFTYKVFGHYKDRQTGKEVKVERVNYLNPMHFISAYWETDDAGVRKLNVFTAGSYIDRETGESRIGRTLTFGEREGERCITHMEEFYEYLLWSTPIPVAPVIQEKKRYSGGRRAMQAEVIEEFVVDDPTPVEASFE